MKDKVFVTAYRRRGRFLPSQSVEDEMVSSLSPRCRYAPSRYSQSNLVNIFALVSLIAA